MHTAARRFLSAVFVLCLSAACAAAQPRDLDKAQDSSALPSGPAPDAHLNEAAAPLPKAVFLGDSITQNWAHLRPKFFADNGYVGRGVSGQTSILMLRRFRSDVVALKPAAVLILAGTNDVGSNKPVTDEQVIDNLQTMVEIAHANSIKVVICSITPAARFYWKPEAQPAPRIVALNAKIKAWAASQNIVYADFWTAMALPDGEMNPADSNDAVHPNPVGFAVMEPIAKAAIEAALAADR